jgi:hypothetical protein
MFHSTDYTKETMLNLIKLFCDELQSSKDGPEFLDFSTSQTKPVEEMDKKELEEHEEAKKKKKLRLYQELMEFKKKGGFAKILHDLFYNPDINALEFDSVYRLKQLCMQYYEKK